MTGILTKEQMAVVRGLLNNYNAGNFGPCQPTTAKERRWLKENLGLLDDIDTFGDTIAITWSVEDVKAICPRLSKKQSRDVLEKVKRYYNPEHGICRETIRCFADSMFPRKRDKVA